MPMRERPPSEEMYEALDDMVRFDGLLPAHGYSIRTVKGLLERELCKVVYKTTARTADPAWRAVPTPKGWRVHSAWLALREADKGH